MAVNLGLVLIKWALGLSRIDYLLIYVHLFRLNNRWTSPYLLTVFNNIESTVSHLFRNFFLSRTNRKDKRKYHVKQPTTSRHVGTTDKLRQLVSRLYRLYRYCKLQGDIPYMISLLCLRPHPGIFGCLNVTDGNSCCGSCVGKVTTYYSKMVTNLWFRAPVAQRWSSGFLRRRSGFDITAGPSLNVLVIQSTPALRTLRYYGQQLNPRRKLQTFDWNKLPLLRTYGHFIQSQFYCFLSRYSGHRATSWNICVHIKSIFSVFWDCICLFC